jgi:membrane associated rhomboid family serine protease
MVNRGARSPEVLRTRSVDSRRSRSLDSHNSYFKPTKISSITALHQRQKSSIGGSAEKRKIYQPPIIESGFQGRDDRGPDAYAPFSPGGGGSDASMTGKWNRVHSTIKGRSRGQIDVNDYSRYNPQSNTSNNNNYSRDDHEDRSLSYYRDYDSESYMERDNYSRRGSKQQQQQQYYTAEYGEHYDRSMDNNRQSRGNLNESKRGRTRQHQSSQHRDRAPNAANTDYRYYDEEYPENLDNDPALSPRKQRRLSKWYTNRFPVLSKSESTMGSGMESMHTEFTYTSDHDEIPDRLRSFQTAEGSIIPTKLTQEMSYFSFGITAIQLLILMIQLFLCGLAPLDVNPMVGPFPAIFSEWGGKNPYLMVVGQQWWRMITPTFLHVGILHFLANAFCQLVAIAQFEREWGSKKWISIYIMSALGTSLLSNYFDSDSIAVTSSGAVMGMYAAKLAEVTVVSFFDSTREDVDDVIQIEHMASVICGLVLISLLGSFTFIDWSGNMGGLLIGFFTGLVLFGDSIKGCCSRFFWISICLGSLIAGLGFISYEFYETINPDDQLSDVCEYFRHMYPENSDCQCFA